MAKKIYERLYKNASNLTAKDVYGGAFDALYFKKKKESDFVREIEKEQKAKMSFIDRSKNFFKGMFEKKQPHELDEEASIVDFNFMQFKETNPKLEYNEELGSHRWSIFVIEDLPKDLAEQRKREGKDNHGRLAYYQAFIGDAMTYSRNIAKSKDTKQLIMVKRSMSGYRILLGIIDRMNSDGSLEHIKTGLLDDAAVFVKKYETTKWAEAVEATQRGKLI